jgi:hypothetical protein
MIWNGKYVTVKPIIEKVYRDMQMVDQLNLGDAVEWIGEAIEFIGAPMTLKEKVELISICQRKGRLPIDVHYILSCRASSVTLEDCPTSFSPMRYSTDIFHHSCSENIDCNCISDLTYKVNDDYIFPNFDEGTIQIAYKALPICKDGFPLIPDDVKFRNAVAYHIMWKLAFIKLMSGKITQSAYQIIERDRDWYMGAAQTRGNTPSVDFMESIKNNWLRLIKKINQQSDGFKSAGTQEQRYTHNSLNSTGSSSVNTTDDPTFFNYKDSCNNEPEDM